MKKTVWYLVTVVATLTLIGVGCVNSDEISRLEKENADLKVQFTQLQQKRTGASDTANAATSSSVSPMAKSSVHSLAPSSIMLGETSEGTPSASPTAEDQAAIAEVRASCANQAEEFFNEDNRGCAPDLPDNQYPCHGSYSVHYNQDLGKCFLEITDEYFNETSGISLDVFNTTKVIYDLFEHSIVASSSVPGVNSGIGDASFNVSGALVTEQAFAQAQSSLMEQ